MEIVYQPLEGLHEACPHHKGDWYFSGNYPTPGGVQMVNRALIHYIEQMYDFKQAYDGSKIRMRNVILILDDGSRDVYKRQCMLFSVFPESIQTGKKLRMES